VSRIFNGVRYNLVFDVHQEVYEFNLNTTSGYPPGTTAAGEKCSAPSYWVQHLVYEMINDLPLNPQQAAELKENARVQDFTKIGITF
jgi:hypothetical protein